MKGWKGTSWSFPRGKKNKDEEDHACAIREVSFFPSTSLSLFLVNREVLEICGLELQLGIA